MEEEGGVEDQEGEGALRHSIQQLIEFLIFSIPSLRISTEGREEGVEWRTGGRGTEEEREGVSVCAHAHTYTQCGGVESVGGWRTGGRGRRCARWARGWGTRGAWAGRGVGGGNPRSGVVLNPVEWSNSTVKLVW